MVAEKATLKLFEDAVRSALEFVKSIQPGGEFSEEDIDTLLDPNSSLFDTTAESSCSSLSASVLSSEFGTPSDILTRGSPRKRKRKKLHLLAESTPTGDSAVKKYRKGTGNGRVKGGATVDSFINRIDPLLETSELESTFSFSREEDSSVVAADVTSTPFPPHSTASTEIVATIPQSSLTSSSLYTPTSVTEIHSSLSKATSTLADIQSLVQSTPHCLGDRFVSSTPISASSLSKTTPSPIPTRSSSPSLASTGIAVITPSFSDSEDELPAVNLSAKEICGEWYRSE